MNVPEIKPVQLTPKETALRQQMEAEVISPTYTGKAASSLFKSLQSRNAIPQIRIDYFTKPYPGGHGKSHRDVFENNGRKGDAILEHAHFVSYLRYFIDGPALPANTIEGFRNILIEEIGTTDEMNLPAPSPARMRAEFSGRCRKNASVSGSLFLIVGVRLSYNRIVSSERPVLALQGVI